MSAGISDCGICRVLCLYRGWTELFSHVGMDISSGGVDRVGQAFKQRSEDLMSKEGSQRVQEVTRDPQCQVSGGQQSNRSIQPGSDSQAEQAPVS